MKPLNTQGAFLSKNEDGTHNKEPITFNFLCSDVFSENNDLKIEFIAELKVEDFTMLNDYNILSFSTPIGNKLINVIAWGTTFEIDYATDEICRVTSITESSTDIEIHEI